MCFAGPMLSASVPAQRGDPPPRQRRAARADEADGVFHQYLARPGGGSEGADERCCRSAASPGAGLDVLEHEPPDADEPILRLDNVLLDAACSVLDRPVLRRQRRRRRSRRSRRPARPRAARRGQPCGYGDPRLEEEVGRVFTAVSGSREDTTDEAQTVSPGAGEEERMTFKEAADRAGLVIAGWSGDQGGNHEDQSSSCHFRSVRAGRRRYPWPRHAFAGGGRDAKVIAHVLFRGFDSGIGL